MSSTGVFSPVPLVKPTPNIKLHSEPSESISTSTATFIHLPHRLSDRPDQKQRLLCENNPRRPRSRLSSSLLQHPTHQGSLSRGYSDTHTHYDSSSHKRSRQPVACDPCRASKRKCSGGHPCLSCQKRGSKVSCYYDKAAELRLVERKKTTTLIRDASSRGRVNQRREESSDARFQEKRGTQLPSYITNTGKRRRDLESEGQMHRKYQRKPALAMPHKQSSAQGICLLSGEISIEEEEELSDNYMETIPSTPFHHSSGEFRWRPCGNLETQYATCGNSTDSTRLCPHSSPCPMGGQSSISDRRSITGKHRSLFHGNAISSQSSSPLFSDSPDLSTGPQQSPAIMSSDRSETSSSRDSTTHTSPEIRLGSRDSLDKCLGTRLHPGGSNYLPSRQLPPPRGALPLLKGSAYTSFVFDGSLKISDPTGIAPNVNALGLTYHQDGRLSAPLGPMLTKSTAEMRESSGLIGVDGGSGSGIVGERDRTMPSWIKPYPYLRPSLEMANRRGSQQRITQDFTESPSIKRDIFFDANFHRKRSIAYTPSPPGPGILFPGFSNSNSSTPSVLSDGRGYPPPLPTVMIRPVPSIPTSRHRSTTSVTSSSPTPPGAEAAASHLRLGSHTPQELGNLSLPSSRNVDIGGPCLPPLHSNRFLATHSLSLNHIRRKGE